MFFGLDFKTFKYLTKTQPNKKPNIMNDSVKLFAVLIILFFSYAINAQEKTEQHDKSLSPYFWVKSDDPDTDQLPLLKTYAEVDIAGVMANVQIHQVYKNEGKNPLEAIYTFPASTRAAVYAMEMKVGKRKIVAQIEEREKAKKQYEEAKKEGKRASLLEQERPNVFKMNVANIMPGDSITVTLKYTELLIPENGTYEFVYPTVVGPRYAGESDNSGNQNDYVNTPYQKEGEAPLYNFDINVKLSMGLPIQDVSCSTHKINIKYPSTEVAEIRLDPSENKGGNRDYILEYQLAGKQINTGLMLYEGEEENFFLTMIQPPERIEHNDIPPREYIFINDVSGSMRGHPMDVSKKIMRNLVGNLRPVDRFNVLVFAGSSGWMSDESLEANKSNINKAVRFVDNQRGGGGTNILRALRKALSFPRQDEAVSRTFVIVTDGYVSVEREVFDLIRQNNNNANVFVFGIGRSVNRYLIEGMAHCGMGEPFIVTDQAESNEKAEKFRKYISNPVLTQIEKDFSGFDVYDVQPLSIPDVFAQRPILIFGKYKGNPEGKIKLKGYAGKKRWNTKMDVSSYTSKPENEALKYLWARKQIELLSDYGQVANEDEGKITQLGLKYNLLTNYTSFIAIEEKIVNENGETKTVKQPIPMPQGVSNAAIGAAGVEVKASNNVQALYRVSSEVSASYSWDSLSVRHYKEIKIKASFSEVSDKKLKSFIQDDLMKKLNTCFMNYQNNQKKMIVKVGADGKVKAIEFDDKNISKDLKTCLKLHINRWDFSTYNLNKDWEFEILF